MKCEQGDLAVVVSAVYKMNIGLIVRVIELHDGKGSLTFKGIGPIWLVSCSRRMKWTLHNKIYRRKIGPVPEYLLQPIRGMGLEQEIAKRRPKRVKQTIEQD